MIIKLEHDADGHHFVLRGIRYRDELVLAEILRDRADDGTGEYTPAHARVNVPHFQRCNDAFKPLPCEQPQALHWMLDRDGETIAFVRIVYWFEHAQLTNMNVHPEWRGQGIGTTIVEMLMRNIGYLGEKTVSWEAMESAPQVDRFAEKLGVGKGEERIALTGQKLTHYQFTSADQAQRIKNDPNAKDVTIDGKTPAEIEREKQ